MSSYSANQEITSTCADFVVELRGFEPLTSAERVSVRGGGCSPSGPQRSFCCRGRVSAPGPRPLLFTCPTRGYRFERLAGLGENRRAASRGFIAAYDHMGFGSTLRLSGCLLHGPAGC
jgi:hypothetical protein